MSSPQTKSPTSPPGPRPQHAAPSPTSKLNVAIDPLKLLRQNWIWLGAAGFFGIGLGIAVHFALLFFAPVFSAKAYFQVYGVIREASETESAIGISEVEVERYLQSQVALMISDDILRETADNPRIRQETAWSKKFQSRSGDYDPIEAFQSLKDIVTVRPVPETNYFMLTVSAGNRNDAETIAQTLTAEYQDNRRRDQQRSGLDIQQLLTNQLNAIQEERLLITDRMRRLLRDNNLTTLDEKLTSERIEIQNTLPVLQETRYNLSNTREQLTIYEEQLAAPGGANYPEIVRATVRAEPIIQTFDRRIAELKASLRGARDTFGPNHRAVKQLEISIASTEDEMDAQEQQLLAEKFVEFIEGMRTQIRTLSTIEEESVARLEEAQARLSELQVVLEDYELLADDLGRLATRETEIEATISEAHALQERADSQRVRVIQQPTADQKPIFPNIFLIVPAVTVLLVGFVGGVIFLRELMEQRVRGPADLLLIPRLRIAGVIPALTEDPSRPPAMETAVLDRPDGVISEAIRHTRGEILKRFGLSGHKTLLVVGGMPGSGATSFTANFARSCASCELKTLIIDANLRRPGIHSATGVNESPGLADVLSGDATLESAIQQGDVAGLDVISAGSDARRRAERLITKTFETILAEVKDRYDIILLDAPPAIVSSDAFTLAAKCDASLLVIRAYSEKRGLVTRLRAKFDESNSEFMGVIMNGVRSAAGGYYKKNYLETHQYSSNAAPERTEPRAKKPKKKSKKDTAPQTETIDSAPSDHDKTPQA